MTFTIELDDVLLDALRAIDPEICVYDGDDPDGQWRSPGDYLVADQELQEVCRVSKGQWKEQAPLLARAIAELLDQAAMHPGLFPKR